MIKKTWTEVYVEDVLRRQRERKIPEFTFIEASKKLNNEEDKNKMRPTGFKNIAVVEISHEDYYYALYDDDIKSGDYVIVSGGWHGCPRKVNRVIAVEDIDTIEQLYKKEINEEIMCKVDLSAYEDRVQKRKRAAELKEMMDKTIQKMDEINKYDVYAKNNPELADMLAEYRDLVG